MYTHFASKKPIIILAFLCIFTAMRASSQTIYWSDKDTVKIQRMDLDSRIVEDVLTSADGLIQPRGFDIDTITGKMYWADSLSGKIQRANLDGSQIEDLVTGLSFPSDLQLDLSASRMYWADTGSLSIKRANLDGTGISDVISGMGGTQPYYIHLAPEIDALYWTDVDSGVIHTSTMAGDNAHSLITGLDRVRDIAVDLSGGKIYWGDRQSSTVQRANLDGSQIEPLFGAAQGLDRPHGLLLDADTETIYWTDTRTSAIHSANMDGSGSVEIIAANLDGPWAMAVVPEPATFMLFGIGAVMLRRRK